MTEWWGDFDALLEDLTALIVSPGNLSGEQLQEALLAKMDALGKSSLTYADISIFSGFGWKFDPRIQAIEIPAPAGGVEEQQ